MHHWPLHCVCTFARNLVHIVGKCFSVGLVQIFDVQACECLLNNTCSVQYCNVNTYYIVFIAGDDYLVCIILLYNVMHLNISYIQILL